MECPQPRLICYGHDEMLQYTRKCILEREFLVESCSEISRLAEILAEGPVDVVVLCHSVPEGECEEAIELSRATWPDVKVLVLRAGTNADCSVHSDKTMECLEGPPVLLYKVHSLLAMASA
jgi:DNA-binding NarL/FixJ family response regulator